MKHRTTPIVITLALSLISFAATASPTPAQAPASPANTRTAASAPFVGTFDVKVTAPKGGSGDARFHIVADAVASEVDMGGTGLKSLMRLKTRTLTKDGVFMLIDDASKSYR